MILDKFFLKYEGGGVKLTSSPPLGKTMLKKPSPIRVKEQLSTSQKQVVKKLIEKKDRDKRFIKNWKIMSLLNTVLKLILKALAMQY